MFEHGLIVGKFAPFHRGHQFLVETALAECHRLTVLVYSRPDFVAMPQSRRVAWISAIYPAVQVYVPADPPPDDCSDAKQRQFVRAWLAKNDVHPDAVFSSELYGEGFARHLGVRYRLVDLVRQAVPVRGSAIRRDPRAHRDFLDPLVFADLIDAGDLNVRRDDD